MKNEHVSNIQKLIKDLSRTRSPREVFSDFIELSACTVSNTVDPERFDEREEIYKRIIKRYKTEEQSIFPELFAELVLAMDEEVGLGKPRDILGEMYNALEMNDVKGKAQVFTPQHVCDMMAKMVISQEGIEEDVRFGKGYISVCEPACGAGAMVLGAMRAIQEAGYNYCANLVVHATDLDLHCVHMCYLQLALYGVPAVVIHGNTLTQEEFSRWYTPIWVAHGWSGRLNRDHEIEKDDHGDSTPKQL